MRESICHGCGESFEAKRRDAKWCSERCRKAASRRPGGPPAPPPVVSDGDSGLVAAVIRDLTASGRLDTIAGRLAVELARQVSAVDATGVAGLSRELRVVIAEALADVATVPAGVPVADEVDEVRSRREAKAREATR